MSSSVPLGSGGAPVPTPKSSADEGVHEDDVEAVICDTPAVHYENTTIDGASILAEGVDSISFSKVLIVNRLKTMDTMQTTHYIS